MRGGVVCFVLLLAALSAADDVSEGAAADDIDDDGDFDLDDDLDDDDAGSPPPVEVEDFDLGLPEEDRQRMMASCFHHSVNRLGLKKDEIQTMVKEMVNRPGSDMSETQALNTLLFSWMMACYMNVKVDSVSKVTAQDTKEMESSLFDQRPGSPQHPNQASRRQWKLLEEVVTEMRKHNPGGVRPPGTGGPGEEESPVPPGAGSFGSMYALIVFAVIFGLGAIVVLKLVRAGSRVQSERDAKRAEKAEKKLARKKK